MIDIRKTLRALHKKFPLLSLDDLFTIIDCYIEDSLVSIPQVYYTNETPPNASTTIDTVYGTLSATSCKNDQFTKAIKDVNSHTL